MGIDLRTFQANNTLATITENSMSVVMQSRRETFFMHKQYDKVSVDQDFTFNVTSSGPVALCNIISWGSVIGDLVTQQGYTMFGLYHYEDSTDVKLISVSNGITLYSLGFVIAYGSTYYGTITKSGTAGECRIYSDSGRTILVATLNITSALSDVYTNQSLLGSFNNDFASTGIVNISLSDVVDNLDTFSIKSHAQKTNNATVSIDGVAPASSTVNWTGTGGATSGSTSADGSGNFTATVTLGSDAENVLTFTTSGEADQIISVTQGGVDYVIDSAIIDDTEVTDPIFAPTQANTLYDGLGIYGFWTNATDTKVKIGMDEGSGLAFKTLQTARAGHSDTQYIATLNNVFSSFHHTTVGAGTDIREGLLEDDYSVNYTYTPSLDSQFFAALPHPIISSCVNSLDWTYVLLDGGNLVVTDSQGTLQNKPGAYDTFTLSITGGTLYTGQILCNIDDGLMVLSSHYVTGDATHLKLNTSPTGLAGSWTETTITTDLIDYKFFQGIITSDGKLRIFYVTKTGLKCATVSAAGAIGSEVDVLDNVTSFTATAVNSKDDRVLLGIPQSPYFLSYVYEDGVLDSIPVEMYDDVLAGGAFVTSPITEPQVVPYMFQNMAGHMACATATHTVTQRASSGEFVGVGRSGFSAPVLLTHQETGFDKSIVSYGGRDDWGYLRAYDWDTAGFETATGRATTQKYNDFHSRMVETLAPSKKLWLAEGGRLGLIVNILESDNVITSGSIIDLLNMSLVDPASTVGLGNNARGYKDILIDSVGNIFLINMELFDLFIDVFDGVSWASYHIYDSDSVQRMYWQGSRIDSNDDVHIGINLSSDGSIPTGSLGAVNSLKLDYLKLSYTGSGFTAVGSDGSSITVPCTTATSDQVIMAPDAIAYYSVPGYPAPTSLTTTDMLFIGYFDKRSMELDSLNNPVFAGMQVGIIDFEDVKGIYIYRRNGSVWESVTISNDVNLDTLAPQIVKSADGDSLICIYAILDIIYYKVSPDDGATWGAQKVFFDEGYPIQQMFPVASSRGLDIVTEKHVDRSYTEITLQSIQFAFGSVQITIEDDLGDPVIGATWFIDGMGPYTSGQTVTDVLVGDRLISYSSVIGYTTPPDENITVLDGVTATDTAVYVLIPDPIPDITITSPTTDPTYATDEHHIDISGTSSITSGTVDSVTWVNDRAGSGSATGTSNWTFDFTPLVEGVTNFTITGTSDLSKTGTDAIEVTYTPGVTMGYINLTSNWPTGSTVTIDGVEYSANEVISLTPGVYSCVPNTIEGYTTPASQVATVIDQQTTNISFIWRSDTFKKAPNFRTLTVNSGK